MMNSGVWCNVFKVLISFENHPSIDSVGRVYLGSFNLTPWIPFRRAQLSVVISPHFLTAGHHHPFDSWRVIVSFSAFGLELRFTQGSDCWCHLY